MRRLVVKPVHICVHPDFYRILEDNRQMFSKKVGIDIKNTKYTEILAKSNIKFNAVTGGYLNVKKRRRF